ncbi:unnamed protein product, partial [Phaeothamnion confervicola]
MARLTGDFLAVPSAPANPSENQAVPSNGRGLWPRHFPCSLTAWRQGMPLCCQREHVHDRASKSTRRWRGAVSPRAAVKMPMWGTPCLAVSAVIEAYSMAIDVPLREELPEDGVTLPPPKVATAGRPKQKRVRSAGEGEAGRAGQP